MVVVALLLRLVVMSFLYPERTDPYRDHWRLGGEAGRIARSITEGEGFSNPLFGQTGPTAWLAPVFPYLLAGIFKIFGIYSKSSAIAARGRRPGRDGDGHFFHTQFFSRQILFGQQP
jgi:hypothetical protein